MWIAATAVLCVSQEEPNQTLLGMIPHASFKYDKMLNELNLLTHTITRTPEHQWNIEQ